MATKTGKVNSGNVAPTKIDKANLQKLHAVLHAAGFQGHTLDNLTLRPPDAVTQGGTGAAPPTGHMECTAKLDGSVVCQMVSP